MTKRQFTPFWGQWSELQGALGAADQDLGFETNRAWRRFFSEFFGTAPETHWLFSGRRFKSWMSGKLGAPGKSNPFVSVAMSKGGGLLSLYVLHLLSEQPRYGNDIMRQIEGRTRGRWNANPGAIYPLLDSMEEQGLVGGEWEDPKKRTRRVYTLTSAGREELHRISQVIRPKLHEAIEVLSGLYEETGQP